MTNKEAIAMIRNDMKLHHDALSGEYRKALKMAIKALEKCENWTQKEEKEFDHEKKADDPWIPFKLRPLTEEEKEDHPDQEYMLDCLLPDDGQQILVSIDYKGRKMVTIDEVFR